MLIVNGSVLSGRYLGEQYFITVDTFSTTSTSLNVSSAITCNNSMNLSDSFHQLNISYKPNASNYSTPIKPLSSTPGSQPSTNMDDCSTAVDTDDIKDVLQDIIIGRIDAKTTKLIITDVITQKQLPRVRPSLASIGGLKKQIRLLQELVVIPLRNAGVIDSTCVQFPHGILLHGPPGTGKSLLAEVIAGCVPLSYWNVFNVVDSEAFPASSNDLETVLDTLDSNDSSPHVIVVNDIHLFVNGSPQFRTLVKILDFANSCSSGHIVVIATTNHIQCVIGLLRQQGRFDYEIEVPAPSSSERLEILQVILKDIPNNLTEDDVSLISSAAHGYVGMDLKVSHHNNTYLRLISLLQIVCREAQYNAYRRMCGNISHDHFQAGVEEDVYSLQAREIPLDQKVFIDLVDLQKGLNVVKPSAVREIIVEIPKVCKLS